MPTINQLVRKPRKKSKVSKSDSPALNRNALEKKRLTFPLHKKGVCTRVGTMTPKNLTQLYVNMRVRFIKPDYNLQNTVSYLFVEDV